MAQMSGDQNPHLFSVTVKNLPTVASGSRGLAYGGPFRSHKLTALTVETRE